MDQHIKEIEKMIVDAVVLGLEKEQIEEKDLPRIANYVLDSIDNIQTNDQMLKFLDELSLRWPIFENIRQVEKAGYKKADETEAAHQALDLIKSGNFQEATNLTKKVIN